MSLEKEVSSRQSPPCFFFRETKPGPPHHWSSTQTFFQFPHILLFGTKWKHFSHRWPYYMEIGWGVSLADRWRPSRHKFFKWPSSNCFAGLRLMDTNLIHSKSEKVHFSVSKNLRKKCANRDDKILRQKCVINQKSKKCIIQKLNVKMNQEVCF